MTEFAADAAPVEFADIADLFLSYGTFMSPAFYDGRLVASIALATHDSDAAAAERWLVAMSDALSVEAPRSRHDAALLLRWRAQSLSGLSSDDMSFEPLLPDGLFSVAERVRALQEWTLGFVEVLDEYGVEADDELSSALKEALQDMRAIAESHVASEFEAIGFDDDGEHEEDLLALHEHVRVAAILLWLERHPGRPNVEKPDEAGAPALH